MAAEELVLVVSAKYAGAVGFGDVFACGVKKVLAGKLSESRINLTVLASDQDKSAFLMEHMDPATVEIGFTPQSEDEPYDLAPVSGFVDKSRRSWRIGYLREARE